MTTPAHRRHDISDDIWKKLEPYLPGRQGSWGGIAQNNRLFINAIFWIMRTGAPWRDLPPDFGGGVIHIAVLSDGATTAYGKDYLKY